MSLKRLDFRAIELYKDQISQLGWKEMEVDPKAGWTPAKTGYKKEGINWWMLIDFNNHLPFVQFVPIDPSLELSAMHFNAYFCGSFYFADIKQLETIIQLLKYSHHDEYAQFRTPVVPQKTIHSGVDANGNFFSTDRRTGEAHKDRRAT